MLNVARYEEILFSGTRILVTYYFNEKVVLVDCCSYEVSLYVVTLKQFFSEANTIW